MDRKDSMLIVLELSRQYSGMDKIPDEALAEHGLCRFFDESLGVSKVVSLGVHGEQLSAVRELLIERKDYLFAYDYQRLNEVMEGKLPLSEVELARIAQRTERLVESGLPPIYDPAYFGKGNCTYIDFIDGKLSWGKTNSFPQADFLIQFATGALERYRKLLGYQLTEALGRKSARKYRQFGIRPTPIREIFRFCRMAFTDDARIMDILVRDANRYAAEHFARSSTGQDYDPGLHRVAEYLQHQLSSVARTLSVSYRDWDGDVTVVENECWYLEFPERQHEEIAAAYFASVKRVPRQYDGPTFRRISLLFPEMAPTEEALQVREHENLIDEAIRTGRYTNSGIPHSMYRPEHIDPRLRTATLAHLTSSCERMVQEKDLDLLGKKADLMPGLHLSSELLRDPAYRDAITAARIALFESFSDAEFVAAIIRNNPKLIQFRYGGLGNAHGPDDVLSPKLRAYIKERGKRLFKKR